MSRQETPRQAGFDQGARPEARAAADHAGAAGSEVGPLASAPDPGTTTGSTGPEVVDQLDALLAEARRDLRPELARRLTALARAVPGRRRLVARVLADHPSAAAVDALLELPSSVPGVVEGLYRAFARGVTRRFPAEDDGPRPDAAPGARAGFSSPAVIALDLRNSRSRHFPGLLRRARLAFGPTLERLELAGAVHHRVALRGPTSTALERPGEDDGDELERWRPETPLTTGPAALDALELADEFVWLHGQLGRLRGTRLWINGWCFPHTRVRDGITHAVQVHLVRAWFDWVRRARASSATTSSSSSPQPPSTP